MEFERKKVRNEKVKKNTEAKKKRFFVLEKSTDTDRKLSCKITVKWVQKVRWRDLVASFFFIFWLSISISWRACAFFIRARNRRTNTVSITWFRLHIFFLMYLCLLLMHRFFVSCVLVSFTQSKRTTTETVTATKKQQFQHKKKVMRLIQVY